MTDEWKLLARCRDMDPAIFYPPITHKVYSAPKKEAARACAECSVRDACWDYAMRHEDYGYWAGTSDVERRQLRKVLGIALEPSDMKWRWISPHGTPAAYQRHKRNGESACDACRQAHVLKTQEQKEAKRSHHAP